MLEADSDVTDSVWLNTSSMADRDGVTSSFVTGGNQLNDPAAGRPGSILSTRDFKIADRVIECGFLPAMCFLGLPANILNMAVFYRQGLRDKMNLCLFTLAFADFVYVLCNFVFTFCCPVALFLNTRVELIVKWHMRKNIVNVLNGSMYTSGFLTAIIATERCICVVWPMKSATIFKTKTMALLVFGAVIVINLLCLPYAFMHVVSYVTDDTGNVTVLLKDSDLFMSNRLVFLVLRDTILPSISFITFFIVSFVTAVTVRKLKTAMDWRQKTSGNVMDKRQLTLVKILITVSCVYIVCNVPKLSLAIVRFVVPEFSTFGKLRNLFSITHRVGWASLMVNSSVNIFIYYRQSSRFRKEFHACSPCFKDKIEEIPNA